MTKKKRQILSLVVCLVAVLLIGGTLAAWYAEKPSLHIINTGALDGLLVEEYIEPDAPLMPGATVDKVVNVQNIGEVDMMARIKIVKQWGDKRTNGKLVVDKNLSGENIEIVCNTEYWYDGGDGYFYYKGVLEPGDITLAPLFTEFTVSGKNTGNEYKNKFADIVVKLECIQAGGNAIEKQWDITFTELGVIAPTVTDHGITKSTFISPEKEFEFSPRTTDLFANFKDLVPGETREQVIQVTNLYSEEVEIFLRAEFIGQVLATEENFDLVNEMLQKYAVIKVTNNLGEIIYDGPVWGNYDREPSDETSHDSMKNNISLGDFNSGKGDNLTVELTLDPSLDNRYQDLWGLIYWVWSAQGIDPNESPSPSPSTDPNESPSPSPSTDPNASPSPSPSTKPGGSNNGGNNGGNNSSSGSKPKTGDESNIVLWAVSIAVSAAALGTVFIVYRKKRNG